MASLFLELSLSPSPRGVVNSSMLIGAFESTPPVTLFFYLFIFFPPSTINCCVENGGRKRNFMFLFFCFLLFLSPHSVPTFTNLQEETLIKIADVLDEVRVDNRIHRYIFQNYLYGYNPLFMKKKKTQEKFPFIFYFFWVVVVLCGCPICHYLSLQCNNNRGRAHFCPQLQLGAPVSCPFCDLCFTA